MHYYYYKSYKEAYMKDFSCIIYKYYIFWLYNSGYRKRENSGGDKFSSIVHYPADIDWSTHAIYCWLQEYIDLKVTISLIFKFQAIRKLYFQA